MNRRTFGQALVGVLLGRRASAAPPPVELDRTTFRFLDEKVSWHLRPIEDGPEGPPLEEKPPVSANGPVGYITLSFQGNAIKVPTYGD